MAATPVKAAKGGGNVLTKKFGPLPGWAWAGLGVLGFYLYKQRKASEAATAAAATTATPSASLPTSDATAPSGYGYQGPGVGTGGSGAVPIGATATTSGGRHYRGGGNGVGTATTAPNWTPSGQTFQPAPNASTAIPANIVAEDNAFTQQLANQTGTPQTGVVGGTASGLPGGASFITNPAVNDPSYNPATGI